MVKHFALGFRITVLLALLLMLYAVLWLQGGPRDVNWARGWLTGTLNPEGAPYSISIGDVTMRWNRITEFGTLNVRGMQLSRKDGAVFATIPQVKLTLDPLGFLPHHRGVHGIEIDRPHLGMTRDEQGVIQLGIEGVEGSLPVPELVAFFASDDSQGDQSRGRLPFRQFDLKDAALHFTDLASGDQLSSDHLYLSIGRSRNDLHGALVMPFLYKDKPGNLDAAIRTNGISEERVLSARLDRIPSELVCMFALCPADLHVTGAVSGTLALAARRGEGFTGGSATLNMEDATIDAPTLFPETLALKKGGLIARVTNGFSTVAIDGLTLEFPDTKLGFKALLNHRADGWYAQGSAVCSRLNVRKLYQYWPLPMAHDSREWVMTQLKKGYAESGTLKFDFAPADLQGDSVRDEAVDATVLARGMEVAYLPGFPNITEADGTVHFTGKTIHIDIDGGKLLGGTTIRPSTLDFTDLDIPATPMKTVLNLSAPAGDVATILKLKPFTFDDGLNLDPATIGGSAEATVKLAFDAFSKDAPQNAGQIDFSDIGYDIDATLSNISQKKLIDGRDIAGLSGTVKANPKGADFEGMVKLDGGTDLALTLTDGPGDGDTLASAKGTLARSQFATFGIPDLKQVGQGSIGIDAQVELHKDTTHLKRAAIDLTPIALSIGEIGWSKPAGTPAKLTITPGKAGRSYGVDLQANGLAVDSATLTFTEAMDDIATASLPRVKTATSDFSLDYATKPQGYAVKLRGAALDASAAYNDDTVTTPPPAVKDAEKLTQKPLENSILADFPALDLDLDLQTLVLVKEYPLRNVKGTLRCDALRCNSADISATTGAGALCATIGPVQGKRQLAITDSNAGDFLRTLDISDRVFGGALELKGTYDDTTTPAPLRGRLLIQDFKLKNSQILARIISIGSLSGLVNVLTGQGIDFEKFGADIGARGGVINVTEGRTQGNALGLTIEGSVDTNSSRLDLKGVVVPVSSINSLLGNIPLIGALAGGKGEGLIAFNYSVKGPMADPEVFVNPLSGLTPGFLRNIFKLNEKKVDAVPAAVSPEKPAPDASVPEQPVPWPGQKNR